MPYLQLEVNESYPTEKKKLLAQQLGETFSRIMEANVKRVTVSIRELGIGSVWRCTDGEPVPAPLLMCDIRRGRSPEKRAELAKALIAVCEETLGLKADLLNIEFTQHAGDEMYHPLMGGLSDDWTPDEE
jgi:phenylpyruvate tautomerase PptA (4-oxalocrotonate tautomerase family)